MAIKKEDKTIKVDFETYDVMSKEKQKTGLPMKYIIRNLVNAGLIRREK